MQTRVIVNGAQGKMGALACATIQNHPEFKLVSALGRDDNLRQAISTTEAEIVVDLTRADCVFDNSLAIIESGAHPVIGTSGLLDEQIQVLKDKCEAQKLGGIIAPNFSIAAVLMMRFAAEAARLLPEVEIIETHHQQKLDAPSGTAMKTAEMIAKARTVPNNELALHELVPGARGGTHQGIKIHSIRLPGFIANQQVIFGTHGETLTITHNSIDRASFMPGVILACQRVLGLDKLYYGLENLLGV
ncbi:MULTISPECIES: 4-hydroxy-tetrahydrodipicolinate reductase [Legionella]|uniref:4-hydroxy-tetrahydrodipicolinate reductase n=1 Tax=Legionella drozanskii LLAP-1 TaxID=1212489 RepID=A0A0W0SXH8_9GAMM|nr:MULTISPECIES: 4-hydroxy-tetrahydrodipicolinate reductase [Legionella]KTC88058.1 Dihydrodipicolinate reductase [Legionella drozanskii LLAP-1]PJE07376.1 MAG: 4-hydroxy-tetrahydrodipicolinate reductase [Legionella sp.]